MSFAEEIRTFIADNFLLGQDSANLDPDGSLMEAGIMDSTGVLELIAYLENTHGIQVLDDEVTVENFDTINRVATYLQGKVRAAS